MKKAIAIALIFILAISFGFGVTAGIVYSICWGLGLKFTWKMVIGIYLAMVLYKVATRKKDENKKGES